eukprot:Nk52_evm6s2367 gene=Nk52_evmTU6s2367
MNSIIVLCHFCEMHGPSTLFCTQSFHSTHDPLDVLEGNAPSECASYYEGSYRSFTSPTSSECGSVAASSMSSQLRSVASVSPSLSTTCKTCRSLEEGRTGFITNDHGAHISYISSKFPNNANLYSIVRQACVRSLSCEVCPGREGPVLFGDDKSGYIFSYTFKLKDGQARGFQRWYTIIVIMTDKNFLVSSWPFLVSHLRVVVDDMQTKANGLYESDKQNKLLNTGTTASGYGYVPLAPGQFRRRRYSSPGLRSLVELCGDVELFAKLHTRFSWILKACGSRLFEQQVEGPAMIATSFDTNNMPLSQAWLDAQKMVSLSNSNFEKDAEGESIERVGLFFRENDKSRLEQGSFVHLLKIIGKTSLMRIIDNVVVGNQLVVRGNESCVVTPVLYMIKELLPGGCCNMVPFDTRYHDEWECNFLGISNEVKIPSHVAPNSYVLLDVEKCWARDCLACDDERDELSSAVQRASSSSSSCGTGKPNGAQRSLSTEYSLNGALIDDAQYGEVEEKDCSAKCELPSQGYDVGESGHCIKIALVSPAPTKSASMSYVTTYTNEILNVLASRKCSNHLIKDVLLTVKENWVNKSKIFFRFSRTKESESQLSLSEFLTVIGVQPLDLPVLRFWTAALSKKDRTKLLVEHRD